MSKSKATKYSYLVEGDGFLWDEFFPSLEKAKLKAAKECADYAKIIIYKCEAVATGVVPNRLEWQ